MSSPDKIRVVFDCNTFLQAALNEESPAGNCYKLVEKRIIQLFVSKDILAEIEDVINRPQIRERFDALTDKKVGEFLKSISELSVMVKKFRKSFRFHAMLTTSLILICRLRRKPIIL